MWRSTWSPAPRTSRPGAAGLGLLAGGLALLSTTLTSYVYVWETTGRGVGEPGLPEGSP
ncbi:MAG TPA: hypothetical protein VIK57_05685 [Streptosporangiaceae bacterium]